jgi:Fe-S cluster assembly ATP-binding protein
MFLAFQYPEEIPASRRPVPAPGPVGPAGTGPVRPRAARVDHGVDEEAGHGPAFGDRYLNEGFSGGEKKRNEILQLAILEPELADPRRDRLRTRHRRPAAIVAAASTRSAARPELGVLVVTHYQRILEQLRPDVVHLLVDGDRHERRPRAGQPLEEEGYEAWR